MFDAIATVVDAHAKPLTNDDDRSTPERQAEALADACGHVLDHGDIPESGGHRPRVNVLIWLEELENRAHAACLAPVAPWPGVVARALCCDARVVPIVMNGQGQPVTPRPTRAAASLPV
jgi:5-methylcytosine-specific restriction protein A